MPKKNSNAKFAFYYLLGLVALILTALGVGLAVFQFINRYVPDLVGWQLAPFDMSTLQLALAFLLIAAPIYYVLVWLINKNLKSGELDKQSAIRRWLTYLILFAAAVVIIVWLIITISQWFNGDLTTKFIFKAATAIAIAGVIFSYYLLDIRREKMAINFFWVNRGYWYGSMLIVLGVIVIGFMNIDSPSLARAKKLDQTVVNNLMQIDSTLSSFYSKNTDLPKNLSELTADRSLYLPIQATIDPINNKPYDYQRVSLDNYKICAWFNLPTPVASANQNSPENVDSQHWQHSGGYQCFTQKVQDYNNVKPVPIQ